MFLHFDSIGLIYLGSSNKSRLECFSSVLREIANRGGNILIPAFSYSFCRNEIFSVQNSPTTLGDSHEFLRLNSKARRTSNGIFSYLVFGSHPVFSEHMNKRPYQDCFGQSSLLSQILDLDGWIGSIGGVIQSTTEIHHIEKKVQASYRYDKVFNGQVIHNNGERYEQKAVFFCRDLDFYKKTLLGSDLSRMYQDLENNQKMKELNIDNEFLLDYVAYSDIYETVKRSISHDPHYLLSIRPDMYAG